MAGRPGEVALEKNGKILNSKVAVFDDCCWDTWVRKEGGSKNDFSISGCITGRAVEPSTKTAILENRVMVERFSPFIE